MTKENLKKSLDAIEAAGITRYLLYCNNSYLVDVGESTKAIYDDANEVVWYLRVPNSVQPKDPRPIAVECFEYSLIERVCVPSDFVSVKAILENAGVELPEEINTWLKTAASQVGLYPIQSYPEKDEDGNQKMYSGIPSIH